MKEFKEIFLVLSLKKQSQRTRWLQSDFFTIMKTKKKNRTNFLDKEQEISLKTESLVLLMHISQTQAPIFLTQKLRKWKVTFLTIADILHQQLNWTLNWKAMKNRAQRNRKMESLKNLISKKVLSYT